MKKILAMVLSIALVATMAITGSIAYLQDTDDAVNVMTLGNVYIDQIEQERAEDGSLTTFSQNKPAYPAVGPIEWAVTGLDVNGTEYKVFTDELKNVVDKIVTVKNTGESDAFVRTIIAIEAPDYDPNDLIHMNYNSDGLVISNPLCVEIDGVKYVCFTFTYNEALIPQEISAPSLMQLFLDSATTNEDCAKFGDAWDVSVISQAVQAAGFEDKGATVALDTAFGPVNVDNLKAWFGGIVNPTGTPVKTALDLKEALEDGENVSLIADINVDEAITISEDVTLDLNGFNLDASANDSRPFVVENGATLTIDAEGTEIDCGTYGLVNMTEGTLTINGGTFTNEQGNNGAFIKVNGDEEMVINLNNVTYKAGTSDSGVLRTTGANVTVNINGGEYEAGMGFMLPEGSTVTNATISATNPANMWPAVYATGKNVTITGSTIKSACHAIAVSNGLTVTVENCDVQVAADKLAFQVFSSGGTINVNNCTYTGKYGTTGPMNAGCVAIINIDGVEAFRKTA